MGLNKASKIAIVCALLLQVCLTCVKGRVSSQKLDIEEKPDGPKVLLTVSSLAAHTTDGVVTERLLELNWFDSPKGLDDDPTSWVGLFDHDPKDSFLDPLEITPTRGISDGYYRTKVQFPRLEFLPNNMFVDCLGYWIGYVNLNRLVTRSCIRTRPNWMYDMRHTIGNRTLLDLMIPGTHNAGSYEPYKPERNTPKVRYQMCQDEDVWSQLVYGNRFLDLRVLFQHVAGSREKYWISHNFLRTNNSLREVLSQVKRFMDNTNEIVVMDFHLFYLGFIDSWVEDRHKDLINLIIQTLGNYMMPTSFDYTTTLNHMWKTNKRLLVGYASKQGMESNLLYPGVFHLWGNKETTRELEEFLDRNVCHFKHSGLWSAMAELTPTTTGMLIDKYGSLRIMAQDVNRHVTRWFKHRYSKCSNIVATDFFLGNNIIEVSIEANKKKWQRVNNW